MVEVGKLLLSCLSLLLSVMKRYVVTHGSTEERGGLPVMTASITIFFARREEFRQEGERWRKYRERRECLDDASCRTSDKGWGEKGGTRERERERGDFLLIFFFLFSCSLIFFLFSWALLFLCFFFFLFVLIDAPGFSKY